MGPLQPKRSVMSQIKTQELSAGPDGLSQAAEILGVSEKLVAEMEILASLEKNVEDLKRMVFFST